MSEPIIRWTLRHADSADRRLTCIERLLPYGCECSVLYYGLPIAKRVVPNRQELEAWAAQIRHAWETAGWLQVG